MVRKTFIGKYDYSNHCCYINRNRWIQHVETTYFNIVFTKESVNFDGIKNFNETIGKMHQLNINLGNINDLQQGIDRLILVFNGFFILCIVSLIITILTIVFNRTVLKVVNILVLAIMLVITLYFSYIIKALAQEIADALKNII